MKTKINKYIIKLIIFIILGCVLLNIITVILLPEWLVPREGTISIRGIYNERKKSIDVVFVGDSNVYMGISPMLLWKKSGITGYVYSSPEQNLVLSYYLIKEYFKYQSPKVVMLDVDKAFNESNIDEANIRKVVDNMKISKNKIDLINDKFFKINNFDKTSCVLPILRYHTRWHRLGEEDFRKIFIKYDAIYKGYSASDNIKSYSKKIDYMEKLDNVKFGSNAKQYLEKIIKLCNENNTQLVLMKVPCIDNWSLERHNDMQKFADENNLKFFDMNWKNEASINWEKDSTDEGIHLNIYGAEKATNSINEFLKSNYSLKDHRNDKSYSNWNDDLRIYEEDIKKLKDY